MHGRQLPDELRQTWEQVVGDADPMMALRASKALWKLLAGWQGVLVADALGAGATWGDIGAALGTTRQAAWARFKGVIDEGGAVEMDIKGADAQRQVAEEIRTLEERLKAFDAKTREERRHLQHQVRQLQSIVRTTDKQMARERQALQEEMRRMRRAARG